MRFHRYENAALTSEAFLDGSVLLLTDVGHEVRGHQRIGWAVELQLDEGLALGEQQYRHSLRGIWRRARDRRAAGADRDRFGHSVDVAVPGRLCGLERAGGGGRVGQDLNAVGDHMRAVLITESCCGT